MQRQRHVALRTVLVSLSLVLTSCGREAFPVVPTPVITVPAAPSGGNWSGTIVFPDRTTTSLNITLIARELGMMTTQSASLAQTDGTIEVSGRFETGTGLTGAVQGRLLQGNLQNGWFRGSLVVPSCAREYAGPVTESAVAWAPVGDVPLNCPLNFSIQLPRERGPDCQYRISLSAQSFSGGGGTGAIEVETTAACPWVAESPDPWIQFDDPTPRVGPGSATFTIAANGAAARDGQIRLAGPNHTLIIRQGSACQYVVTPTSVNVAISGGDGRVTVSAASGCEWTAESRADWIAVDPPRGAGDGSVTFTAQPNLGLERQGTIIVAGQTIAISQGTRCDFTVTPASISIPLGGGSGSVTVAGPAGCAWTAETDANWITVSPSRGVGTGNVSYSAPANAGPNARQGAVRIAGRVVTVVQGACSGPVPVALSLATFPAAGGSALFVISAPQGCPWEALASHSWLVLAQPTSGSGPGTVGLTVQENTVTAPRTGRVTVAGQAFDITQAAPVVVETPAAVLAKEETER